MMHGPNQYAYSRGPSYHDILFVNICSWISDMELGWLVGVYCSDVAGAFDRVDRQRLCNKLRVSGFHPKVIAFLMSWSENRTSRVVLGGVHSLDEILANSVFQGTVLGPFLWNIYDADARFSVNAKGFAETVFLISTSCVGG